MLDRTSSEVAVRRQRISLDFYSCRGPAMKHNSSTSQWVKAAAKKAGLPEEKGRFRFYKVEDDTYFISAGFKDLHVSLRILASGDVVGDITTYVTDDETVTCARSLLVNLQEVFDPFQVQTNEQEAFKH